jgi:hypothetical protein
MSNNYLRDCFSILGFIITDYVFDAKEACFIPDKILKASYIQPEDDGGITTFKKRK